MSKLRILVITPWFHPATGFGGGVERTYKVMKKLCQKGHEITVLTTDARKVNVFDVSLPREEIIEGMRVFRFHVSLGIRQFFITPSMIGMALEEAKICDVIYACGMRNFQTDIALLVSRLREKPFAVQGIASVPIKYDSDSSSVAILKLLHNCFTGNLEFRLADLYIAASKVEKTAFEIAGVRPNKITLIPSGADLDEFKMKQDKNSETMHVDTILFVGRISPIKGIGVLLNAFKIVLDHKPRIKLIIAGAEQGYDNDMLNQIKQLKIEGSVTWIKDPSRKEVANLMNQCTIFVLPSHFESNPIVIHEAGAFAKPVVASNVGGIPELIVEGHNGLLFPRNNAVRLAENISRLLEDPILRDELGHNLQMQVFSTYNLDVIAKKTEDAFYGLVLH